MIVALFKMFGIFLLIILIVIIFFILSLFNKMRGKGRTGTMFDGRGGGSNPIFGGAGARSGKNVEQCPSCHQPIMVSEHPGNCPKCGTPLGRSKEGKLLIRVN